MKLAPIMPMYGCDLIDSDYNFCFAELALKNPVYAAYYRDKAKTGTVIMDTMIFERGRPIAVGAWLDALDLVRPTVAIALDTLQDGPATRSRYRTLRELTETPLMGVAQGKDYAEFMHCFTYFIEECEWIGLPVQLPARRRERFMLLNRLRGVEVPSSVKIHLLGASSDQLYWEQEVKDLPYVMGVDTTKPIAAALNGFAISGPEQPDESKRSKDFFEKTYLECLPFQPLMQINTDYMRSLLECNNPV